MKNYIFLLLSFCLMFSCQREENSMKDSNDGNKVIKYQEKIPNSFIGVMGNPQNLCGSPIEKTFSVLEGISNISVNSIYSSEWPYLGKNPKHIFPLIAEALSFYMSIPLAEVKYGYEYSDVQEDFSTPNLIELRNNNYYIYGPNGIVYPNNEVIAPQYANYFVQMVVHDARTYISNNANVKGIRIYNSTAFCGGYTGINIIFYGTVN